MMYERQTASQLSILVILIIVTSASVTGETYHIVPNTSFASCKESPNWTCFTLADFTSKIHPREHANITLKFMIGKHLLANRFVFNNMSRIELRGTNTSVTKITCQQSGGFDFQNVKNVIIKNLDISGCCQSNKSGGAFSMKIVQNVTVTGCNFHDNHITGGRIYGGVFYLENINNVSIQYSTFIRNSAKSTGLSVDYTSGGAISIHGATYASVISTLFTNNEASFYGGAFYIVNGVDISFLNCQYKNNSAAAGGAVSVVSSLLSSSGCLYTNNSAGGGGAIYTSTSNISSFHCYYDNNNAGGGAAISTNFFETGSELTYLILSTDTYYTNNRARFLGGGAILCSGDKYIISNNGSYFTNNSVVDGPGGGIICGSEYCRIVNSNTYFTRNRAKHGGAIYADGTNISIFNSNTFFTENFAVDQGGAIFLSHMGINRANEIYSTSISSENTHFSFNTADKGAAIHITYGVIHATNTNFTANQAVESNGTIYMTSSTLLLDADNIFASNQGSIYTMDSHINIFGSTTFVNNSGGAITSFQTDVCFNSNATVIIVGNTAIYGGGLSLFKSKLRIYSPIEIRDNVALLSGGGIYAYQCDIKIHSHPGVTAIHFNRASRQGGGIHAIATNIEVYNSSVSLHMNKGTHGGAIALHETSKIYLKKITGTNNRTHLHFTNNTAEYGGAIYVSDSSNAETLCKDSREESQIFSQFRECFIQTIKDTTEYSYGPTPTYMNTYFGNNMASLSGNDIYGGLLDRCTISDRAELIIQFPKLNITNGFDYIKTTLKFEELALYSTNRYNPETFIHNITRKQVKELISSDVVQVCFCEDNSVMCHLAHLNISVKKGELFKVSVVAVDQIGNPANATIVGTFSSQFGLGGLKRGQKNQMADNKCTELQYNVYAEDNYATVELYAKGPCNNMGISKRLLYMNFLPCTCLVGFQPSISPIECKCECDQVLRPFATNCSFKNENIVIESDVWISYVNSTNNTGFIVHPNCPFDYCTQKPINVNFNTIKGADIQCAFNRTGKLCGKCTQGLSLVFGSSRCKNCSSFFIVLLLPFAAAGIVLVIFLLLLNMTVAAGTIHGLALYANILVANRSILLPFKTPAVFILFVSWLNLDLGTESCFYDGMDSYAKVLLQIIFPVYVLFLIALIIVLCEYSKKFATLLAKKNPVATLSTLIMLSYSKLLRIIIACLAYTYLDYPDGSREIVWLYDANVPHLSVSHIPRFIVASIIIILGTVYTVLLFFGQWFPRCSRRKLMKWTKNTKYNAFIDAYQAPFTPKCRYWAGLLLFVRIIHHILSAFVPDPFIMLSVCCIVLGLLLLKAFNSRTYKNWVNEMFETLFLVNLGIFAVATTHVQITSGNQLALATVSISIAFITFLGICTYHIYSYVLRGTQVWNKLVRLCKSQEAIRNRRQNYGLAPLNDEEPIIDELTGDSNEQLREPALDILDPVYTDDYRDAESPPHEYDPPVVTFTVIDGRPDHKRESPIRAPSVV